MKENLNIKVCKNSFSQFRGLRFSKKKELLFILKKEDKILIDMLFVFFPLNVVFIDSNYVIKEIKKLYPFTFYLPKHKSKYIFETPFPIDLKTGNNFNVMKYND